ncbi:transposase, partial [Paenibacillus sp. sgz302251]|uniref:transposase n=1 Tax=Paenibacillus sp. sgz302251 TaxID=3414493 RepID=UPI003C7B4A32
MNCTPIVRHHLTIGGAVFLTKFNLELKKEAINQYLSGTAGAKSIAKSLGVNHEVLRMWIKQYEYHGLKAFEKSYTAY